MSKNMSLLPASIAIIFNQEQTEVLLVKRADVPVWVLPGGGIEKEETPEDALIREIQEETGLTVKILRKSAEYIPINRLAAFTSVFVCLPKSGNMILSNETSEIAFYPINQLPSSIFPPHALWLSEALSNDNLITRQLTEISYRRLCQYFFCHPWQVFRFAWTRFLK
ncbi:MAG: NUDIX hydrolase [Parachlamydiaceae bacterium]